jgi:hypothetical protein
MYEPPLRSNDRLPAKAIVTDDAVLMKWCGRLLTPGPATYSTLVNLTANRNSVNFDPLDCRFAV